MGDNIFTTLMEIGAILLILLVVAIAIMPFILNVITATLPTIITFFIFAVVFAVGIAFYVIQGITNKMQKEL